MEFPLQALLVILLCTLGYLNNVWRASAQHPPTTVSYSTLSWAPFHYACQICPSGTFSNKSAESNCTMMDSAGLCAVLNGTCPRRIDVDDNSTSTYCEPCPDSMWSPGGVDNCIFCPDGFAPAANRSYCVPCSPGRVSNNATDHMCTPCEAGHVAVFNNTACARCEPGFSSSDHINCSYCGEGTPWNNVTALCEAPCAAGEYCPLSNVSFPYLYCERCLPCDAGSFSAAKSSECTLCNPGTYQPDEGRGMCIECPDGYYQQFPGRTACSICPKDHFCPNKTEPYLCPSDRLCPPGSRMPTSCPQLYEADKKNENCIPTVSMIAILVLSCLGGFLALFSFFYFKYRQYVSHKNDETMRHLLKKQNKDPIYCGL